MNVRDKLPKRRDEPTKNPSKGKWSQHKPDLRIDFNEHCGYCGSYDGFRHTWFEVDHFIPKSFFEPLGNMTTEHYTNLVYSCKFCNNIKSDKWPTNSEDIFNENEEGFVDPCDIDFDNHFYRTDDGAIMWSSDLGKWMFTKAFKFDERVNSIKILWNLNQIRKVLDALVELLKQEVEESNAYNNIKLKAQEYSFQYYLYHKELIDFYNE